MPARAELVECARDDLVEPDPLPGHRQRAGLQTAHVQEVFDQSGQPVEAFVGGGEQIGLFLAGPEDVGGPQAGHRGLRRCQGTAQVVADRAQQGGAGAVGFGQVSGVGSLGGEPVAVQRDGGLGCERGQHTAVRSRHDPAAQRQVQIRADGYLGVGSLRCRARVGAADTDHHPGVARPGEPGVLPFEQRGRCHPERLADPVEHRGYGVLPRDEATGQGGQCVRLGAGPCRVPGAAGGDVDNDAHGGGDHHEHAKREDVLRVAHIERVRRICEEPVGEQTRTDRCEQRRVQASDNRDIDDHDEVEQQVTGQVDVAAQPGERHGESGQADRGEGRPDDPASGGESTGELR